VQFNLLAHRLHDVGAAQIHALRFGYSFSAHASEMLVLQKRVDSTKTTETRRNVFQLLAC